MYNTLKVEDLDVGEEVKKKATYDFCAGQLHEFSHEGNSVPKIGLKNGS